MRMRSFICVFMPMKCYSVANLIASFELFGDFLVNERNESVTASFFVNIRYMLVTLTVTVI